MSKERLYWQQNAAGYVFLSSPESPLRIGFRLESTASGKEMDKIFNILHEQEREHNQKIIDNLFSRGKENFDRMRSELRRKIGLHDTSNAEKNIIREAIKRMDEKE